jgi:hypothetical protein
MQSELGQSLTADFEIFTYFFKIIAKKRYF